MNSILWLVEKLGSPPPHLDFPGRGNGSGATVCPFTGRNEGFSGRKWGHTGSFFLVFASAIRFVHGDGGRDIGALARYQCDLRANNLAWTEGRGRHSFRSSRVRSIYQTPRKLNRRVSLKNGPARKREREIFVELSVCSFSREQVNSIFFSTRFNRE